jgi:ADP-heptose:LPS heptosyltransferase
LKNKVIYLLLWIARLFYRSSAPSHRFLIISTTGIGDTLWGTPALRSLKEEFPQSYIAFLTSPLGGELLKNSPDISELFILKKPYFFSFFSLIFTLKKRKIDTVFIFHASQRLIFPLSQLIHSRRIIGTEGFNKGLDGILTDSLTRQAEHEIERRYRQVKKADVKKTLNPSLNLQLSLEDIRYAESWLKIQNIDRPFIVLHPGAQNLFKQWPIECFVSLGKKLREKFPYALIISGSSGEKALVKAVSHAIADSYPLCGSLALRPFASLLQKAALVIANDTGPMHLSLAVGTQTIGIFAATDPAICGGFKSPYLSVFHKPATCKPCLKKKCREPFCLLQISSEEVFEKAQQLLIKPLLKEPL